MVRVPAGRLFSWWGTDPKTRKQEEIDIMGVEDKNTTLFGEGK